jgi:uncharacterized protein (TIGR00369 family)
MAHRSGTNPDFAATVAESFARQGFMASLGAELISVEPGRVQLEAAFRPELSQQHDYFHAGVTAALVDSSCGYAALTLMPVGSEVLTVEYKINLFAPARGERLVAHGRVVRAGATLTVCHGDAFAVAGDQQVHCATLTATMIRRPAPE